MIPQPTSMSITTNNQTLILDEIARLRELIEEKMSGQTDQINRTSRAVRISTTSSGDATTRRSTIITAPPRQQTHIDTHIPSQMMHLEAHLQPYSQDIGERVTDLQLAVNRLHQDVSAIRQVVERMSPLSASLILGRAAGLK